ncbi:MAG TPA: outer membrane protein transport protein [Pseudomonadales bacterium]|nr:outer membrane protein transport protein [Pseudomonadales bacterium]
MFALFRHCLKPISVSAFLGLSVVSLQAHAVLTDSLTVGSAKALALGHAVTADPPGIDSVHFNPAGLAQLKGRQRQLKVITATFNIKLKFGDYIPERQTWMDSMRAKGLPESYFADEAHNSVSESAGATLMLPGLGMTDLPVLIGPTGGFSYNPPGSSATFATSVYTPMAVGFYREDNDPGRFIGQRLSFMMLSYFTPSFAYEFNDEWSVGATMTFNYAGVGLELPFRSGQHSIGFLRDVQLQSCPPPVGNANVSTTPPVCQSVINLYEQLGKLQFEVEQPMTIGFNFGVLWHPVEWATVGLSYQAPVPMKMKGTFEWQNGNAWNQFLGPLMKTGTYDVLTGVFGGLGWELPKGEAHNQGKAKVDMTFPENYAIGTSIKITPNLKWNFDYKHAGWSSWQMVHLELSEGIDFLRLGEIIQPSMATRKSINFPLGFVDTWNWGTGIEYQWNDRLALRAGVEDRPSSIPLAAHTPFLPMGSGKIYSLGFGYKMPKGGTLDAAFAIFSTRTVIPGGSSKFGNDMNPWNIIYNPFPGTDITADLDVKLAELSYRAEF